MYDLWFLRYRECPYSVTFPYMDNYKIKYTSSVERVQKK